MKCGEWRISEDKQNIYIEYDKEDFQYKKITLNFQKVKSKVTNKYRLFVTFRAEVNNICNTDNRDSNVVEGSVYCDILGMDEQILNLKQYGLFVSRKDVLSINKLIEESFMFFKDKEIDISDEEYKEILSSYLEFLDDEKRITVKNFNDIFKSFETSEITLENFKKWLIDNDYLVAINVEKNTDSQVYTKIVKMDKNPKRVYIFNEDKIDKLTATY